MAPEFVKWVSSDHTRPCVALDKSPFFPGVLLSVGDWSFQIWKVKINETNKQETWCGQVCGWVSRWWRNACGVLARSHRKLYRST